MLSTKTLDPKEAPEGFYAVLKSDFTNPRRDYPNLCTHCDWRKQCCDPNTNLAQHNHRCMSDAVIVKKTGETVERKDGCSVVFKKIQSA